jgi:glycosyltransferase involved in cell wall biosynthesis
LKIVLVSGSLPDIRCGIGDYTARLASELARAPDLWVSVITSESKRVRADAAAPAQVLPVGRWGLAGLAGLLGMIRRLKPDVVHIQYPAVGYGKALGIVLLPLALRWTGRVPVVLTIHERRERRRAARLAIDLMALSARTDIMLDPLEAADLARSLPPFAPPVVTGHMISTIPIAPQANRAGWRSRNGASEQDLVLVSFGLLHPRRRLEDIVEVVARLRRAQVPARLWIVGGEAEYDPGAAREYGLALRRRVASLGLDEVVTWLDHADPATVSAALSGADVAVLLYPDGASGRNTTLQAALEHGLPVVTTAGLATPTEMRANPRLVLLPAGAYGGADLEAAVQEARRQGRGAPAGASALPEHVEFHLAIYRRLLESGGGALR